MEVGLFLGVRQFTAQEQEAHVEEVAVHGELFDRVAAIEQHALVAVDVGDARLAAGGGHESGVEREHAVLPVRLRMSTTSGPMVPDRIGRSTLLVMWLTVRVAVLVSPITQFSGRG
ncbi:MAG: hypothetical protein U1E63_04880 [Burkholderiales bacterium]